jgi:quinol-cytochrome oxidoreductase complex cytochrome b subunit/mono/diheme cytochrome c family protein
MKKLIDWIDHRTGIRGATHEALYENIPSGARLRYVTGSMLVFAFITQMVTGIFLWMAYSPSSQTAWESVYYIQHEMAGGWFLRGVHHFMAQAMIVLLGLHLLQVIVDKAYKGPREVNFWLGLILMQIVLGLALTGYLLPWDQKGYWATNVATSLMALIPFGIGERIQQLVIGGTDYNHHTLTRFFAMHAGVLPLLLLAFLAMHVAVFRRHGITAKITAGRRDQYFWPHQILWDSIGCLALVFVVVLLTIHFDVGGLFSGGMSGETHGAELGAPADPSEPYGAARPEWYFLFLFQFLKYFHGKTEIIGAIVIPGAVVGFMFLMPFIAKFKGGHQFNIAFIAVLFLGALGLTGLALRDDANSEQFQKDKVEAHRNAERIHELVQRRTVDKNGELTEPLMIPREGAIALLRNDPFTQGPVLFKRHCASCHAYEDPAGKDKNNQFVQFQEPKAVPLEKGEKPEDRKVVRDKDGNVVYQDVPLTGPNLYGFATRQWIRGILNPDKISEMKILEPVKSKDENLADSEDHPENHRKQLIAPYFGNTAHRDGRMAKWVEEHLSEKDNIFGDDPTERQQKLDAVVAALSAQAELPEQAAKDEAEATLIAEGVQLIQSTCATYCHRLGDSGQLGLGPDLTGYGSYEWMMGLVSDPGHERFYRRENDRMPAFAEDLAVPESHNVSVREISLVVDWLRRDYYRKDDKQPRLPHSEQQAEETVRLARATQASILPKVAGEELSEQQKELQRAAHLFALNCASCHTHLDKNGQGIQSKKQSAPNLHGFASRPWLKGFLNPEHYKSVEYFGNTAFRDGEMADVVDEFSDLDEEQQALLDKVIIALSAEAQLPSQAKVDAEAADDGSLEEAREAFGESIESFSCAECHYFQDFEDGDVDTYPDLRGWGSRDWLKKMISDPSHFYEANDRMPSYRPEDGSENRGILSEEELEMVVKFIRGEYDVPPRDE